MEVPNTIMEKYIERRKHVLEECLVALRREKFDKIEKVGHQLKGNGTTFGHPELSLIGKKLEESAKIHNLEKTGNSLKEFSQWLKSVH